jgi:hypothetical protein
MMSAGLWAQTTIPEAIAGGATGRVANAPSGIGPSTEDVLRETELVVRGVVREPRSYLSEDAVNVYTDYTITKPLILYSTISIQSREPGPLQEVTVSQIGGTVVVNGHTFTHANRGLPLPEPGTEMLLLLKRVGSRWQLANKYSGAFAIANGKLNPWGMQRRFGQEYRGAETTTAIPELVARIHAVRKP